MISTFYCTFPEFSKIETTLGIKMEGNIPRQSKFIYAFNKGVANDEVCFTVIMEELEVVTIQYMTWNKSCKSYNKLFSGEIIHNFMMKGFSNHTCE